MVRSIRADKRLATAHEVDIIVRKDGREQRFEADWIKVLGRLYRTKEPLDDAHLPPPVVISRSGFTNAVRGQTQDHPRR